MKYVYGPVPSRRLGFSLGLDLVPYKTCTLDCIYCQLGRTTQKTAARNLYAPTADILEEIKEAVKHKKRIDYITISGSGEPTLNSGIGALIKKVKAFTTIPVAVLTNGTLLFMEDVQKDLLDADIVLPSLDAASLQVFRRVNRPHHSLKIEAILDGLKKFRKLYHGQIWLEIMLIKGFNDNAEELLSLRNAVSEIQPDMVYLNTVVRPPAEIYAKPLRSDEMMIAKNYFDNHCEVIAEFHDQAVGEIQNVEEAIIEMAQRRPLTIIDIANVLGISEANAEKWVNGLKEAGKLKERQYNEIKYYSCPVG
ncbi:MAG TPA: radical SAM protein [Thermodesulfovibrionales bacterium]|jgi:wyosine [tRNA(Phe)-imidazoG37] synthetase (radical SAM superfamily)|nr:radical SAM protein [Thermodesulfovibrionales bacterium]